MGVLAPLSATAASDISCAVSLHLFNQHSNGIFIFKRAGRGVALGLQRAPNDVSLIPLVRFWVEAWAQAWQRLLMCCNVVACMPKTPSGSQLQASLEVRTVICTHSSVLVRRRGRWLTQTGIDAFDSLQQSLHKHTLCSCLNVLVDEQLPTGPTPAHAVTNMSC